MSNGLIVRPIPLAASMIALRTSTPALDAAFPVTALADRQPKTVTQTIVATTGTAISLSVNIDLGADTSIDTIAMLWTNLSVAAGTWQVHAGPASDGGFTLDAGNIIVPAATTFGVAPTTRENRRFGLWTTGTPIARRYITITLSDTRAANPEQLVRASVPVIGQRLAPAFNFELGSGRKVDDQSIKRTLPGGETHTERGGRVPLWRATWSNLSEAEMRALWSILLEVGEGDPLLLIEDPDAVPGQAEAMHWAFAEGLDFHERQQIDKQRIDLRVRELV